MLRSPGVVFISEPIHPKGMEMLQGRARLILAPDTGKETTIELITDADAVILRSTTLFDAEVIAHAPKLKLIARTGVGLNNVDLVSAGRCGIYVSNTPNTNEHTVAEHTLAVILCLSKKLVDMDKAVRSQNWGARFSAGHSDLKGKSIGIIGFGRIGQAVTELCQAFSMKVMVYTPSSNAPRTGIIVAESLEQIFSECDYISLHCPSSPANRQLVNTHLLGLMKNTAYFINTSRGDLVDEAALVSSLASGKIAGAAIDVFEQEPMPAGHPFLTLDNMILSPHIAGSSNEANERMTIVAVQAVLDIFQGRQPSNICNGEHFKRR